MLCEAKQFLQCVFLRAYPVAPGKRNSLCTVQGEFSKGDQNVEARGLCLSSWLTNLSLCPWAESSRRGPVQAPVRLQDSGLAQSTLAE